MCTAEALYTTLYSNHYTAILQPFFLFYSLICLLQLQSVVVVLLMNCVLALLVSNYIYHYPHCSRRTYCIVLAMCIYMSALPCPPPPRPCSKNLDVDEVTVDANANWTAVEKPMDSKDDEGIPRDI